VIRSVELSKLSRDSLAKLGWMPFNLEKPFVHVDLKRNRAGTVQMFAPDEKTLERSAFFLRVRRESEEFAPWRRARLIDPRLR